MDTQDLAKMIEAAMVKALEPVVAAMPQVEKKILGYTETEKQIMLNALEKHRADLRAEVQREIEEEEDRKRQAEWSALRQRQEERQADFDRWNKPE